MIESSVAWALAKRAYIKLKISLVDILNDRPAREKLCAFIIWQKIQLFDSTTARPDTITASVGSVFALPRTAV